MARVKRTCSIKGCDRVHRCKGLCAIHYERSLRDSPDRPRCSVDGCESPARKQGLCGKHYQRLTAHGDPEVTTRIRNDDLARIESHIERLPNGCWEWTGFVWDSGYGRTSLGQDSKRAHIVVWEMVNGSVPEGMTLDHECHNEAAARGECAGGRSCRHRRCVNPGHLVPKPIGENQRASINANAGKTHCVHGHEFTIENTRWVQRSRPHGWGWERVCRACKRERQRNSRA